jgi:hypothetical protein
VTARATWRAVALVDALNAAFGLGLADAAEARAWLADGGWEQLDAWLRAHRDAPKKRATRDMTTRRAT